MSLTLVVFNIAEEDPEGIENLNRLIPPVRLGLHGLYHEIWQEMGHFLLWISILFGNQPKALVRGALLEKGMVSIDCASTGFTVLFWLSSFSHVSSGFASHPWPLMLLMGHGAEPWCVPPSNFLLSPEYSQFSLTAVTIFVVDLFFRQTLSSMRMKTKPAL